MDWLRSLDPQSRTVRTFERRRQHVREVLEAELDHDPTEAEIAARMGVSLARYNQLCRLSQLGKEVHFSAMESTNEQGGADLRGPGTSATTVVTTRRYASRGTCSPSTSPAACLKKSGWC